jgi:hypothetical protein
MLPLDKRPQDTSYPPVPPGHRRTPISAIPPDASEPPPAFNPAPQDGTIIPELPPPAATPPPVDRARQALAEMVKRRREALKLYWPLDIQDEFHKSQILIRLLLGGNRGGKTTPAAVEVARAVTGQDPYGKWPKTDGNFIVVGKDGSHVGKVMYPRLFLRRRNFLTIRDRETGLWRSWRPWDEWDVANKDQAKPAEPLIPKRFIKEISWYSKKDNIPRIVRLLNGWELYFFSSESDPPGGFAADGAWFDEEILRGQEWTEEVMARLIDRQGRFIWSATPQNATEELFNLHNQAEEEASMEKPNVKEWLTHIDQNYYIPTEAKDKFKERMRRRGDDSYQVRIEGKFAIEGFRVFPEYGDHHRRPRFEVPKDWCVYPVTDPGRQVCAVLFIAVPPPTHPEYGRNVIFMDECYIRDGDARKFAQGVKDKLRGREPRAYVIDDQEGRKHDTGSGRMIRDQYSRALKRKRIPSIDTGYGFVSGNPDPSGNREALREWMIPDEEGFVRLIVFDDLIHFDREMKGYHYKRTAGVLTDQPVKKHDHLVDAAGYGAGLGLRYRRPPKVLSPTDRSVIRAFRKKQKQRRKAQGEGKKNFVNLGPKQ